jgi:hypothetical protein
MRDEYGNESLGNVDAEDWKEAWKKLGVLIRTGYKILVINDLDEPEEEVEASDMSILQLVKKGEAQNTPEIEETETLFQLSFALLSGEQLNVCAKAGFVDRVTQWFNSEDEDAPATISLMIENSVVSLDRMFVGAIFTTPLSLDDLDEDEDEGEDEDEPSTEQGINADGDL